MTDATLATWIGALDRLALSTVRRKLFAVRLAHAREQGDRAPRRQSAATAAVLVRLVGTLDDNSLHAARNRAVVLAISWQAVGASGPRFMAS